MGTVFVVNPGSTSRKYALYRNAELISTVHVETTTSGVQLTVVAHDKTTTSRMMTDGGLSDGCATALEVMEETRAFSGVEAIDAVAVRVVAPGEWFYTHRKIDEVYVAKLEAVSDVVPIHVPIVLEEIEEVRHLLPHATLWGISDSSFNATVRPETTLHGLPGSAHPHRGVGFHGLSFSSIAGRVARLSPTPVERVVVVHFGGGISIGALHRGELIATSMGTTPMSGVMMSTRGGGVAADDVLTHLITTNESPTELLLELSEAGGYRALSESGSVRQLIESAEKGDESAVKVLDACLYQVRSWIATHVVHMGGVDALVLTATALERNAFLRHTLTTGLEVLGISIDKTKNELVVDREGIISATNSVPIIVMKTDEMGAMATATEQLMLEKHSERTGNRSA